MIPSREFKLIVQKFMEGEASPEEVTQLNELLRTDPQARRDYILLMNVDSSLAALLAEGHVPSAQAPACADSSAAGRRVRGRWMRRCLTAACLVLAVVGVWLWQADRPAFATVKSGAGTMDLADGTLLGSEWRQLEIGTVELVTTTNARVVVEAPAEFRFESAQRLHLKRGRLAADVPPSARKFTVITPSGKIVDLGTKFGVSVPEQGTAELHVFQGEVIAQPKGGGQNRNLRDGEACRLQNGKEAELAMRSAAFIRPDEIASLHAALAAGQRDRARVANEQLRQDPALIALLDFESTATQPGQYGMVQGRWPGSRAPEFMNVGDNMKIDVGGDRAWAQLTLAAWVRLDHFGDLYQSLLHTNGWGDGWGDGALGQVHWMVTDNSTMRTALLGNINRPDPQTRSGFPDSHIPANSEPGHWVHLACVYDSDAKSVRFYFNGKFDSETLLNVAHPARLGPAQIGNWNMQDRKLSGRIDELLLLGRTMSDDEIVALHAAGNPYRVAE